MTDSIEITFTPGCHGADQCRAVVDKIRALPGVRKVFHGTKGHGDDTCCVMLNGLGKIADIVATIQGIEGVATTKSQMGFGFVPTGA
jgi:hypothetical protein